LARAFYDDPVAVFLFPGASARQVHLERFFTLQLSRNYLRRGVVSVTDDLLGAALWMPPGAPRPTFGERLIHAGFSFQLGPRRRAARELTALLESRHPRERHWYLGALGVEPVEQNQGIGTALLVDALATCDAMGEGAYLEASRPESARLYERLGFECHEYLEPHHHGIDGPGLYLMYRPATRPGDFR